MRRSHELTHEHGAAHPLLQQRIIVKLALYACETRLASASVEPIGLEGGRRTFRDAAQRVQTEAPGRFPDIRTASP